MHRSVLDLLLHRKDQGGQTRRSGSFWSRASDRLRTLDKLPDMQTSITHRSHLNVESDVLGCHPDCTEHVFVSCVIQQSYSKVHSVLLIFQMVDPSRIGFSTRHSGMSPLCRSDSRLGSIPSTDWGSAMHRWPPATASKAPEHALQIN